MGASFFLGNALNSRPVISAEDTKDPLYCLVAVKDSLIMSSLIIKYRLQLQFFFALMRTSFDLGKTLNSCPVVSAEDAKDPLYCLVAIKDSLIMLSLMIK